MSNNDPKKEFVDKRRMVTRDELDALKNQLHQAPGRFLKYEPNGPIKTYVKATERAELQGRITRGERKLAAASQKVDNSYVFSSLPGKSRGDWLKVADEREARNTPKYHSRKDSGRGKGQDRDPSFPDSVMEAVERREARALQQSEQQSNNQTQIRSPKR